MNRLTLLLLLLLVSVGCATKQPIPVLVPTVEKTIANADQRLGMIGALAQGVETTIADRDLASAHDLNKHVESLAETPTPEQVNAVLHSLTDQKAKQELEAKISALIEAKRSLEREKLNEVQRLGSALTLAEQNNRSLGQELAEMRNPVTALTYGVKTLVKRLAWTLVGIGGVYVLLMLFAKSNPVVGAVFDVIQHAVAWIIRGVGKLAPKALAFAGTISIGEHNRYRDVLVKIVDETGVVGDAATVGELKVALDKRMDQADKDTVRNIKTELGY